jgi:hypothetical protein
MIYQDNVEGLAVWLPWDAGETEILAIRDASPVMRQILAELSRQLLVATTYHQGPRAADQPPAFAPFQSLDYIKTPEDLEEYVQARIADQPAAALRSYGGHEDDCAGTAGYLDPRCTCGFADAVRAADQTTPQPEAVADRCFCDDQRGEPFCSNCGGFRGVTTDQQPAAHYPVEWGPSDARQLTCACGNPDPAHADQQAAAPVRDPTKHWRMGDDGRCIYCEAYWSNHAPGTDACITTDKPSA